MTAQASPMPAPTTAPRSRPRDFKLTKALVGLIAPVVIVLIWWLWTSLFHVPAFVFPTPVQVVKAFITMAADGELIRNMATSGGRLLAGVIAGAIVGFPLGLAIGTSKRMETVFGPTLTFFQAIPGLAWVPLALVWFGLSETALVFTIFTTTFFPILLNTVSGIRMIPPSFKNAALTLGARRWQMYVYVIFPGALPSIVTGLRLSIGFGFRTLVGAELIGANSGLGYMLFNARAQLRSDVLVLAMLLMGVLWLIIDKLLLQPIERRTVERWGTVSG